MDSSSDPFIFMGDYPLVFSPFWTSKWSILKFFKLAKFVIFYLIWLKMNIMESDIALKKLQSFLLKPKEQKCDKNCMFLFISDLNTEDCVCLKFYRKVFIYFSQFFVFYVRSIDKELQCSELKKRLFREKQKIQNLVL